METAFWGGQVETRYKKTAPTVQLFGESPGSFTARNWTLQEGRLLLDMDLDGARDVCVLGNSLATMSFRTAPQSASASSSTALITAWSACSNLRGGSLGGDQDNFAIVPVTTGLNRFGRWNRSLNILVQTRDQAELRRHGRASAGHPARAAQGASRERRTTSKSFRTIR